MIGRIATGLVLAAAALAAAAAPTAAPQSTTRMYKCIDASGRTYYTQVPPTECLGRNAEELSRQGRVVKQIEVLTPEQQAAREAEKKKRAEAEKLAAEERRKNTALLNTYSSVKDIEEARRIALAQAQEAIKTSEGKIKEAEKRRAGFDKEKEFYARKPIPRKLQQDIQENDLNVKKEQEILESRKREISNLNARYDDDKRRYLEITRGANK